MEEGLSTTKISYKTGKQPEKSKRSGNYCCVPNCKSTKRAVQSEGQGQD